MKVLLRILKYLAPSKGRIMLVILVSMLTSLFSVVSIYSILPLLNSIFTAEERIETSGSIPAPAHYDSERVEHSSEKTISSTAVGFDLERLKSEVKQKFESIFIAETRQQTLLNICLFLIGSFMLKNLFMYINKQIIFSIQTKTTKRLRDNVFQSIIEMHLDYFNSNRVGSLMNHVYQDVQNVQASISSTFINLIQNPFSILVFLGVLVALSWQLTLFAVSVTVFAFFVVRTIGHRVRDLARTFQNRMGDMNSVLQEKFNGIKLIKSNAFEDIEFVRFKSFTNDFRRLELKINRLRNLISPLNETLMITAIALVLWFGGLQVFNGNMSPNELLVFAFSLYSITGPMKALGEANTQIQIGLISAERLFAVLDAESDVVNGEQSINGFCHAIRFEDVCFKYRKEESAPYVLDHVTFEIEKGKMVALVGQSGSGKSTVVDLLLRFYDVDEGRITVDGIDIRELDYKDLRRMIGVVSQEVILFNDTIEQNIAYGVHGEAEHDDVVRAAKLANAHCFIEEKQQQYNALIGDRGIKLSGGQRQRLAIARAMVKNPELLVFDEATSALDNESEKVVQEAIDHALQDRTALVVAHRLSTVKNADTIIVMDRGRIAEMGSHEELLASNGLYKMYYDIQFEGRKEHRNVEA